MISQDPYPAIPGDYVKIVFQVNGTADSSCGKIRIELMNEFPLSFDQNESNVIEIQSGTYATDYQSYLIAPFKARLSENALDGENTIKLRYSNGLNPTASASVIKNFNLEVLDTTTDFEVSIKDYKPATNTLTFEILNVGKNDVEALTAEIPIQKNIDVKGSRRNIIGSLDHNDDTTFDFEAIPREGKIDLVILYNDQVNVRHQVEASVMFNAEDFKGRVADKKGTSAWTYIIIIAIIVGAIWYFVRRNKKKKLEQQKRLNR